MMETATTLATQSLEEVESTPLVLPASLCDKLRHPSTFNPLAPAWNTLSSLWTAIPPLAGDATKFLAVFDAWMRGKNDPGFWYSFERSGPAAVKLVLTVSGTVFVRHGTSELGTLSDALSSVTGLTRLARVLNHHSLLPLILHDLWAAPLLAQCQKVAGEFMKTLTYRLALAPPGAQNVVQTVLDLFKSICCQFDYKFEHNFGARWELQFYFLRVEGKGRQPGFALYSALRSYFQLSGHPGGFPTVLASQLQKLDTEAPPVLSTPAVSADQFISQRQISPPEFAPDPTSMSIQHCPTYAPEAPPWQNLSIFPRHIQAPISKPSSPSLNSGDFFRAPKSARYESEATGSAVMPSTWFESPNWRQMPGPSNESGSWRSVFGQHSSFAPGPGPDSVFGCMSAAPEMLPAEPNSGTDSEDEGRGNVNVAGIRRLEELLKRKKRATNIAPNSQMANEASASKRNKPHANLTPEPQVIEKEAASSMKMAVSDGSPSKEEWKFWLDDPERCQADPRWVFLVQALALYDPPSPSEPRGSWEMSLDVTNGPCPERPINFSVYLVRSNHPPRVFMHHRFGNALMGVFRKLPEGRKVIEPVRKYLVSKILNIPSGLTDEEMLERIFWLGKEKKSATGLNGWFSQMTKGGLGYLCDALGHSLTSPKPKGTQPSDDQLATLKLLQAHNRSFTLYLALNFLVDTRQWPEISADASDILAFLEHDGIRPISSIPAYQEAAALASAATSKALEPSENAKKQKPSGAERKKIKRKNQEMLEGKDTEEPEGVRPISTIPGSQKAADVTSAASDTCETKTKTSKNRNGSAKKKLRRKYAQMLEGKDIEAQRETADTVNDESLKTGNMTEIQSLEDGVKASTVTVDEPKISLDQAVPDSEQETAPPGSKVRPSKEQRLRWLDDRENCLADPRWVFLVQALSLYDPLSPSEPRGSWELSLDLKAGGPDRDPPTTFTVHLLRPNEPEVTFVHTSFGNALCGVLRSLETPDEVDHVRVYLIGKILDISPPPELTDDDRVIEHIFRVGIEKKTETDLAQWFFQMAKGGLGYLGTLLGNSIIKTPGKIARREKAAEFHLATLKLLQSHNPLFVLYLALNFLVDSRQWYFVSAGPLDVLNFLEDDGARPISTIPGYDPDGHARLLEHQKFQAFKHAKKRANKRMKASTDATDANPTFTDGQEQMALELHDDVDSS